MKPAPKAPPPRRRLGWHESPSGYERSAPSHRRESLTAVRNIKDDTGNVVLSAGWTRLRAGETLLLSRLIVKPKRPL